MKSCLFVLITVFGFLVQARGQCGPYLSSGTKSYIFTLQADNYFYETNPLKLSWSMLDADSLEVEIQKYIPQIINTVFSNKDVSLDERLKGVYTFVGAPRIEILISFKPDGDIFSGILIFHRFTYKNRSEMTDYYLKNYGTIGSAYFHGQVRSEDLLPWVQTFYFTGYHDNPDLFWP